MVMLRPFKALRYNPDVVGDLSKVVAPPYDVISEAHRDALYERDPHNVIRLELGREADRYASAAKHIQEWLDQHVLLADDAPLLAYYTETFRLADGTEKERSGVFGTVRVEPFATGQIRPHERTFSRAKEDRMLLLRATRTNLSPIFGLFAGTPDLLQPAQAVSRSTSPDIDIRDEYDWRHRVWFIRDPKLQADLAAAVASETVYIADGHHRYETALSYSEQRNAGGGDPNAGHNFVLMYLTSMRESGLVVLPTHRLFRRLPLSARELLSKLQAHFRLVEFGRGDAEGLTRFMGNTAAPSFGIALAGHDRLVAAVLDDPKPFDQFAPDIPPALRRLDVTVLDSLVVRGILGIDPPTAEAAGDLRYSHHDADAFKAVEQGGAASFLMNPPKLDDVVRVCQAGEVMPQKSTYFFPKLTTGLLFHRFE